MTKTSLPRVSVIIPVFQDQAGIERCIASLAQQTYPHDCFEVIVVDNGSVPVIRLESAPSCVHSIRCETPGSYAARNAGVAQATGEILAFTDADCMPERCWLEQGVQALTKHADAAIGGHVSILRPDIRNGASLYQYEWGFQQHQNIESRGFIATANLFCRRETFEKVGWFDDRLLSGGDLEWGARARRKQISLHYSREAAVSTPPRTTLRGAITQARRVAAGRRDVLRYGSLAPDPCVHCRTPWHSRLGSILSRPGLSYWERTRVLCAAVAIKLVVAAENKRLWLGGRAERR